MLQLREAILRTLFETGTTKVQISPIKLVQDNYPGASARLVASELTVLAAQGLIRLTARDGAVITAAGLRKARELNDTPDSTILENIVAPSISTKHDSKPVEASSDNSELELDEIINLLSTDSDHTTPTDGIEVLANAADVFELEDAVDELGERASRDVDNREIYVDTIINLAKDLRFLVTTIEIPSDHERQKCSKIVDRIMTSAHFLKKSGQSR
ncbi:MAG: hypothetical protein VYC39_19000 [Myxococcota bacterium]|nr:hypothetical protein [Myxococcota bacterium]